MPTRCTATQLDSEVVSVHDLTAYKNESGRFEPVWTLEIQTACDDTDRILDAIVEVHPLGYGRYQRNASISAVGRETSQPMEGSTTDTHCGGFGVGGTETYPIVELKVSFERKTDVLAMIMDAVLNVHRYEEPVYLREDWASRTNYNPDRDNPNRWWNNARGLPDRINE